jgi:hypothetical protein
MDLFGNPVGAPRPRGLTFFCFATSSRSEVNVGEADGPKGEAAGRVKESKQRKGDYAVGWTRRDFGSRLLAGELSCSWFEVEFDLVAGEGLPARSGIVMGCGLSFAGRVLGWRGFELVMGGRVGASG